MFGNIPKPLPPTFVEVGFKTLVELPSSDGNVDVVLSDAKEPSLPEYHEFELDSLLNAGVNLERVNPYILGNLPAEENAVLDVLEDVDKKVRPELYKTIGTPNPTEPTPNSTEPTPNS